MKALKIIQEKLKAPKNQKNTFGNYKYRSCEDIMEAVKPLLKETDSILTLSDELLNIWDRYYIKATATLKCWEEIEIVTWFAREEETKKWMDGSQITGASSSYARKYALNWLFAIDDTKDSDHTNKHWKEEKQETKSEWIKWNSNICPSCTTENEIKENSKWNKYFKCSTCGALVSVTIK